MKVLLGVLAAGFAVKLAFSAVVTHWFPRPNPDHLAWNSAKEAAMERAAVEESRVSQ
jgi:hypothetical protein